MYLFLPFPQLVQGIDLELTAHGRSATRTSPSLSLSPHRPPLAAKVSPGPPAGSGGGLDPATVLPLLGDLRRQLKQSEVQLTREVELRGQFLLTLGDQQDLMDTLTAVSNGRRLEHIPFQERNQNLTLMTLYQN